MSRTRTHHHDHVLLDVAGAAAYLATTERHVRSMVYRRTLPYVKVGQLLRFDRADLDQWLDEHRVAEDSAR